MKRRGGSYNLNVNENDRQRLLLLVRKSTAGEEPMSKQTEQKSRGPIPNNQFLNSHSIEAKEKIRRRERSKSKKKTGKERKNNKESLPKIWASNVLFDFQ